MNIGRKDGMNIIQVAYDNTIKNIIEELYDQIAIRRKIIIDDLIGDLYPKIMVDEITKILNAIEKLK